MHKFAGKDGINIMKIETVYRAIKYENKRWRAIERES
jgi:hypothetical protein